MELINQLIELEENDKKKDCDCILIRVCRDYLHERMQDISDLQGAVEGQ